MLGDLGFRVFKLASTNIREWDPDRDDLPKTLQESVEHLKNDRTEADILYEILLKLGLDLTVPIEDKTIAGKKVHSVGAGRCSFALPTKLAGRNRTSGAWDRSLAQRTESGRRNYRRLSRQRF